MQIEPEDISGTIQVRARHDGVPADTDNDARIDPVTGPQVVDTPLKVECVDDLLDRNHFNRLDWAWEAVTIPIVVVEFLIDLPLRLVNHAVSTDNAGGPISVGLNSLTIFLINTHVEPIDTVFH